MVMTAISSGKAPTIVATFVSGGVKIDDMLCGRTFTITHEQACDLETILHFLFLDEDVSNGKYPVGGE